MLKSQFDHNSELFAEHSGAPAMAHQGKTAFPVRQILVGGAIYLAWLMVMGLWASSSYAFELYKTYQTPEVFLSEVFDGNVPEPHLLTLDGAAQAQIQRVFNRQFPQRRVRYWSDGKRNAWIFDDIGKEGYVPTTCGFVTSNGVLESARVLIYRESRGEQVAELSFLNQLVGAKPSGSKLDVAVDNITGATLSVKMMERMARTALELESLAKGK